MSETAARLGRPDPFLVYLNLGQGVKIKYPATWRKHEQADASGFVVAFLSPPEGPTDQFSENLNIIVRALPAPMTLDDYTNITLNEMRQISTKLLESTAASLGDVSAHKLVFAGPLPLPAGPLAGKYLQLFTLRNGRSYVVTYTAQAHKFDTFFGTIQQMIDSLEIG